MLLLRRVRVGVPAAAAAAETALERSAQAGVRLGGQPLLRDALRREPLRLLARQRLLHVPGPAQRSTLLRVLTGGGLAGVKRSATGQGQSKEARTNS